MTSPALPTGFLNLDKPVGITSHDVVARCRKIFNIKKIGHAGTLDPQAAGVLILCVGSATRLSEYVMASIKRYHAVIHLGRETTTYDVEGEIISEHSVDDLELSAINAALHAFIGEIDQIPPAYSAIKQDGRKLYQLARSGEQVELAPRKVVIRDMQVIDWQPPFLTLDIACGAGTYIRSIAHDLGIALNIGGSLRDLRRTASGTFHVEDAISLDALQTAHDPTAFIIPPTIALSDWHQIVLDDNAIATLRQGKTIPKSSLETADELALALNSKGETVAVLQAAAEVWKPHKVLST